jgi:epoxyqueuosine reductase
LKSEESYLIADRIKTRARALGFDLCGITTPDPPEHLPEYALWLSDGLHAGMEYMASERARQMRADPRALFPECKSILVLAANYFQDESPGPNLDSMSGKVARYAWGRDYHDVLMHRLDGLIAFVESVAGRRVRHRLYTDTGPLMERELAQRAGLGWIGKNTMLINSDVGSWTLLAEAMLDLELPPDEPFRTDLCGSCTRCIDACPTGAILPGPRRVDSRRCISYLTIEHRGALSVEHRDDLDDWVFGCDVCQQVCPWNERFAQPQCDPDFAPRGLLPYPQAGDLLSLTQPEFSKEFRGSALKRAKRRGLLRNAAVALGNGAESRAVPYLESALCGDPDPVVRGHAAWALARCSASADNVQSILLSALESENDQVVLDEIEAALLVLGAVRGLE